MAPRRRASSLKVPVEGHDQLKSHLEEVTAGAGAGDAIGNNLHKQIHAAHLIRQDLLIAAPASRVKDAFRHLDGFAAVLDVLQVIQSFVGEDAAGPDQKSLAIELLQTLFQILSTAFDNHDGNRKYFRERVKDNGWRSVHRILSQMLEAPYSDTMFRQRLAERVFGSLLSCALEDDASLSFFATPAELAYNNENANSDAVGQASTSPEKALDATTFQKVETTVDSLVTSSARVTNGEPVRIMLDLWKSMKRPAPSPWLKVLIPKALRILAESSTHNLCKMHAAGLPGTLLSEMARGNHDWLLGNEDIYGLTKILLSIGICELEDAALLYHSARTSSTAARPLLDPLTSSSVASFVHFDLSQKGYCSIELPSLAQPFPPMNNFGGYSITMWFQIVKFDTEAHTTLFGAFDPSQNCFLLIYLEKDSHNLILQTSVKSSRPSVRFKSTKFRTGRWYHLAVTHKRPKAISSARASLFVDGEFVEEVKSQYPSLPPKLESLPNSEVKGTGRGPVQAFLGTPEDLATRVGKDLVRTVWRLSSAQVFSAVLSDDLIAVFYRLGPRYAGNFQDCLGSFQTYEASAQLSLRNEGLNPGKDESSDLVMAIRSKGSEVLPESSLSLNISTSNIFGGDQLITAEYRPLDGITKLAFRNLLQVTQGGRISIAVNGAFPSFNGSLLHAAGHAIFTGGPVVASQDAIDRAAWRLGGCTPICLSLLDSSSAQSLLQNMQIFFSVIGNDWRNSEAVERDNGFSIFANILSSKLKSFDLDFASQKSSNGQQTSKSGHRPSLRSLHLILEFVGIRKDKPEESIINNPLAYRLLLVDTDIWRTLSADVQEAYYSQFDTLLVQSKYRGFNSKRLARMRIVKKWIESLRYSSFSRTTFVYFLKAFKLLTLKNFTSEVMRSLALYITYAIYEPENVWLGTGKVAMSVDKTNATIGTALPARRKTILAGSLGDATPTDTWDGTEIRIPRSDVAVGMLEAYYEVLCKAKDRSHIDRFARAVTNKWLLYLLADASPSILVPAVKILSRLLVSSGPQYMSKFADKANGIIIMQHWLQRHWNLSALWVACFAILFGKDTAEVNFDKFEYYSLIESFGTGNQIDIFLPEILPVIMSMFRNGLIAVTQNDSNERSTPERTKNGDLPLHLPVVSSGRSRASSFASNTTHGSTDLQIYPLPTAADGIAIMRAVTRFVADMHEKSIAFRDLTATSFYIQELFHVIYPVVVGCGALSAETELTSKGSDLTFKGEEVAMKPFTADSSTVTPVVRTHGTAKSTAETKSKPKAPRRMSSYVLVTPEKSEQTPKLQTVISHKLSRISSNVSSAFMQEVLENLLSVFADQIFSRKDFPGLGLFMRVPPGFQEHQAYFETFLFRNALTHFSNTIRLNQKLLWEPKVLTNIARLAAHLGEAVYEGWFIEGANDTFRFLVAILEYLQIPEISSIKSVRLCSSTIESIRAIMHRVILLRVSDLIDQNSMPTLAQYLDDLAYWQTALFSPHEPASEFLRLLIYLLYTQLDCEHDRVKSSAANLWRQLLVHKNNEISDILNEGDEGNKKIMSRGFEKIMELDNETFLAWYSENRSNAESLFKPIAEHWGNFVANENRRTEETAKARIAKRRERLKLLAVEELRREDVLQRHETSSKIWRTNIYHNEHSKRQRALQDLYDSRTFHNSAWNRMQDGLRQPYGLFADGRILRWRLDDTEGRNRMRMRLIPDIETAGDEFEPKRRQSTRSFGKKSSTRKTSRSRANSQLARASDTLDDVPNSHKPDGHRDDEDSEDDFEIIDNPTGGQDDLEDKHRKVMRCIQRGDLVENVDNASRIVGLEAIEGLLICGKHHLYLLDNLFKRIDGEIVNVTQAPDDERDQYLQMISGNTNARKQGLDPKPKFESRYWRWDEILSFSKRRFLFRDVALELFFVDGQSYLLTTRDTAVRDEVYQRLQNKANALDTRTNYAQEEFGWRIEALRNPDEEAQSLGTRFTSVFAQQLNMSPATRRWIKGEISNFHYLMLVNTMAGRSYNDLTQYPVFPWIIADYTSDELDLTDPQTYRDLTKPMGCQTKDREAEFKYRYQSFAEMADESAPPFHYGTHYSSAMIVTSYLIRLQPFVQSYLLLQGGSFDHADRLFFSIEKAWRSASSENMSDVRELIPEFYYSPEFLTNVNDYDFGERQSNGASIDNVALPPWAKNDPKIFIAKQREALESDYVTQHLQAWIDLVFGYKQRGNAALEATNVFHHLSYHGAKDLDTMKDPVERLATIGIIHNFGQTPSQVFSRPHPVRDQLASKPKRLDRAAEALVRLPFPVLENSRRVTSIHWSTKAQKVFASGASRSLFGSEFDKCVEWGYFDGSVRFYSAHGHSLIGLFESIHSGHVSLAIFADSKTMITASTDCTVSIWTVKAGSKSIDLQPRRSLFGHKKAVIALAISRSFSVLLSASADGVVMLWDLNRGELVRVLTEDCVIDCAKVNDVTGQIMLGQATEVSLWTLNGEMLLKQDVCVEGDDEISSCAFFEGSGHEYLERQLVFTGHKRGVANIWHLAIRDGAFTLEHVKRLHHMDQAGFDIGASITAILPMEQTVYTGDDDGRVYEWDCLQRQ